MIDVPTVLILGAGASEPYGFPCASALKTFLLEHILDPSSSWYATLGGMGHRPHEIDLFYNALLNASRPTIDAFLEHQPDLLQIGKQSIALALTHHEAEDKLRPKTDDWCELLFNAMASGTQFDSFGANQVSFITFNYDRSLEQKLFNSLRAAYPNVSVERAAKTLARIPIIHVYGQLGLLPWQGESGRPYASPTRSDEVLLAADGIHIATEFAAGKSGFSAARRLLDSMEQARVIFLGFGFDEENFHRLNLTVKGKHKQYLATCFELPRARQIAIEHWFPQAVSFGGDAQARGWKCRQFLEEMAVF